MSGMNGVFAKRRARLLAMKAIRDNHIPGDKAITCPKCGQDSDRKSVAQNLSVCPKCGYHFPIGAYYRLSTILDPGSFRELFGILYNKEAWKLLIHYSELRYRQTPIEQIIRQQPTPYSIYRSIYNKRERSVVYHLRPTRNLAIFSSKDNILNAYMSPN